MTSTERILYIHYTQKVSPLCEFSYALWAVTSEKDFIFVTNMFSSCENSQIFCEEWLPLKEFPTLIRFIRFFCYVNFLMPDEMCLLEKGFSTFIAPVGLLLCVKFLMKTKEWFTAETFLTLVTCIRFFPHLYFSCYKVWFTNVSFFRLHRLTDFVYYVCLLRFSEVGYLIKTYLVYMSCLVNNDRWLITGFPIFILNFLICIAFHLPIAGFPLSTVSKRLMHCLNIVMLTNMLSALQRFHMCIRGNWFYSSNISFSSLQRYIYWSILTFSRSHIWTIFLLYDQFWNLAWV